MTSDSARGSAAMYPGTFDPVHLGHLDVVERAAGIFEHVQVAVYDLPSKPLLFTLAERVGLFREEVRRLANVTVEGYSGLTVHYARQRNARIIVRGLRATSDYDFEYQIATMNRHLAPEVESVFLMTTLQFAYLSSSTIKEVASQGGALAGLVPGSVERALQKKFGWAGA